ncbi:MAG: nuclear transport factor 2 family protein [Solirubrobacterales bacterium]
MSQENVETLRRLIDLWAEGPTDVPTDLVAPAIEFISPLTGLRGRPYRGYDDAREWLRDVREQFETWEYTVDELREMGDAVLAFGNVHMKGRGSGLVLDQDGAWLAHFAPDGRISRMQVFFDRDEALEAVGLWE